jgi:alkylation response protein AidB-like acyl-CoA dehydrogenase
MLTRPSPVVVPDDEKHWLEDVDGLASEFAATVATDDRLGELPLAHLRSLSASGLDAAFLPEEHGGEGLSYATLVQVVRTLAAAHPAVAALWLMHLGAAHSLVTLSPDAEARFFAAELRRGARFANALSEPAGGNYFLSSQQDVAPVEGGWILTGKKLFVSGAEAADHLFLNVRVAGDPAFFGVTVDESTSLPPLQQTSGMRATRSRPIAFDQTFLPAGRRCATPPPGYSNLITVGFAALSIGIAESAIDELTAYARRRQAGPGSTATLADSEWVRMETGMVWAETRAARLLSEQTAWLADRRDTEAMANAAESKMLANEVAKRAAALAVRVCGGSGYLETSATQRIFRDAQAGALMAYSVPFSQALVGEWVLTATE